MSSDTTGEINLLKPIGLFLIIILVTFLGYGWIESTWLRNVPPRIKDIFHLVRGIGTALLVGIFVTWYFIQQEPFSREPEFNSFENWMEERLSQYTQWFIQLRWVAVTAVLGAVLLGRTTRILPEESFFKLFFVMTGLALTNLIYLTWYRLRSNYHRQLIAQMTTDLIFLTLLLHCSGGLENPLFLIYVFHIILAAILFSRRVSWLFTGLTVSLFVSLGLSEYFGLIPHVTIQIFPHDDTGHTLGHASRNIWFVSGRMGAFVAVLLFTTFFVNMIMRQLRHQEAELMRSAQEARTNRQRIEGIIQAAGLGIVLLDRDCQVEWYNRIFQDWFGWGPDDAIGISCPFEIENEDGNKVCVAEQPFKNGETTRHEVSMKTLGDEEREFYITSSPVLDENGEVIEVIQVLQDITERKLMEAEMNHAGKMRLLGRLSSGIAHEIGNPLNSLKTRIHRMQQKDDPEFIRNNLDFLNDQIDRIDEIVHGISQFSQRRSSEWEMLNLNEIIRETLDVIEMDKKADQVDIRSNLEEGLPRTAGVYNQLEQVVLNLLINAVEAMEGTGTLKVKTESDAEVLRVTVSDSGPGVPPDKHETIFSPFFTEKEEGSGLGLSISASFVDAHEGKIEVEQSELGGARFVVEIPVRHETSPPIQRGRLTDPPRNSSQSANPTDPPEAEQP